MRTGLRPGEITSKLLSLAVTPSSALKTALDTLTVNGTRPELANNLLISFTFSADYEVAKTANDAVPDGRISRCAGDDVNGYEITMEVFGYKALVTMPYGASTIALGDSIQVNGTDSPQNVEVAGTPTSFSKVVAKDTTNTEVDVLLR